MHRILDWLSGRPYLLLTLTMLMWGGNAVAGRLAVGEVSPMALTGLRWVVPPLEPGSNTGSGRRTRRGFLCGREAGRLVRHEARRRAMARVADHLSVDDLEARLRSAQDPTATRHFQVIWLLARGHTIADVAAVTSFVPRWIEQLLARYNAHGPEALGDLRRRNGSAPSVLRPE